jgi:transglutaminase-like putative cysteine protease
MSSERYTHRSFTDVVISILIKHYYELLVFVLLIVVSVFLDIVYLIDNFSYLTVILFYVIGVIYFIVFYYLIKVYRRKKILSVLFFILPLFIFLILFLLNYELLLQNQQTLTTQIYELQNTQFSSFLPFLTVIPYITAILLFLIYYTNPLNALFTLFSVFLLFAAVGLDPYLVPFTPYILFVLISFWIYTTYTKQNKNREIEKGKVIAYSAGLSVLILIFAALFVQCSGTYTYSERYEQLRNITSESINYTYAFNSSGFSRKSTRLGGPVYLNSETVLTVKASRPYYLRGSVYTTYNGESWNKHIYNSDYYQEHDYYNSVKNYSETIEINHYDTLYTSTLFSVLYGAGIKSELTSVIGIDRDFFLKGKKNVTEGYSIYVQNEPVEENNTATRLFYLSWPTSITERTKELTRKVVSGAFTKEEKVNTIYQFLTSSFFYSTNVEYLPENRDFVDFFLFTEQKGYCTYFATTAAIMLRLSGIESRYVEGFRMEQDKTSQGIYSVTNEHAHAWVEYRLSSEDHWKILDATPLSRETDTANLYTALKYKMESTPSYVPNTYFSNISKKDSNSKLNISISFRGIPEIIQYITFTYIPIITQIFAGITGIILFLLIFRYIIRNYLIMKKDPETIYFFLKKRLRHFGYQNKIHLTLREHLNDMYENNLKKPLSKLFSDYEFSLYGKTEQNTFTRRDFKQIRKFLFNKNKVLFFILFVLQ